MPAARARIGRSSVTPATPGKVVGEAAKKPADTGISLPAQNTPTSAAPQKTSASTRVAASPWTDVFGDPKLSGPPSPGEPGNVPSGGNLELNIGWDRFEHLMVFVAEASLGLAGVKFRRYGTPGQAQHGIDLAGRRADHNCVVIQCKDYKRFAAASLRAAVNTFAPLNARQRQTDVKHVPLGRWSVSVRGSG